MSESNVFIQRMNPLTGVNDWVVANDDYDYHQEVSRSAFADMLHDTDRNIKYERAIRAAIERLHGNGQKVHVLDIGTGTGLLSMMAARHGADTIHACEAFRPMAQCAERIIARNGFADRITVIAKRSTDLVVGTDLPHRCNMLVTEVFDTELIGEGALSTFRHAHEHLMMTPNLCEVVPQYAHMFVMVVQCPKAQDWNRIKNVYDDDGELLVKVTDEMKQCPGSAAVHDLQLSEFDTKLFTCITKPVECFRFDWTGKSAIDLQRSSSTRMPVLNTGLAQCVFMWWELTMTDGVTLSCAPKWHQNPSSQTEVPWRDHWLQAIYYLPAEINISHSIKELQLLASHDEFSIWFNMVKPPNGTKSEFLMKSEQNSDVRPVCECGWHTTCARTRIGQLNDTHRRKRYLSCIEELVKPSSVVLVLGDGFLTALTACRNARTVYMVHSSTLCSDLMRKLAEKNGFTNMIAVERMQDLTIENGSSMDDLVDVVLSEPYFSGAILPWDNLMMVYLLRDAKERGMLRNDVRVMPRNARIMGVAVRFEHLHKIRLPLGKCQGFHMVEFDQVIETSRAISDDLVEPQPLWEYPSVAVSQSICLATIDICNATENINTKGVFSIAEAERLHGCNGLAFWVDWLHTKDWNDSTHGSTGTETVVMSSGPTNNIEVGCPIEWDWYTRQGVCLFEPKCGKEIPYQFTWNVNAGEIKFSCT